MDYKNLEMITWLVGQFRKAGERGITYDELVSNLEKEPSMDIVLPKRTFHNYLKELRDRFGIRIDCDRGLEDTSLTRKLSAPNLRYRYKLVDEPKSDNKPWTMPFLWALETSAAVKRLRDNDEDKEYVYINCSPTGAENMNILLDAIKQQKCVDLYYNDPQYNFPRLKDFFEPRGLVLKDFVWYLLGHTRYRDEVIWPLYRISSVKITNTIYRPSMGFSPEKFWNRNKQTLLENHVW